MFNLEDYEPVDARIAKWWEKHPEGSLQTELIEASGTRFIVKAISYTADGLIVATGYAEETVSQKGVNATSALENCETSAIGRALANAGFQAKIGKRASREEMASVQRAQATDEWSAPTIKQAIDVVADTLGAVTVRSCKHGEMVPKQGISSKTGKPYSGWVCSSKDKKDQCEAVWSR
jgi:hypothetical protein